MSNGQIDSIESNVWGKKLGNFEQRKKGEENKFLEGNWYNYYNMINRKI
mgnify:CR=1 FL=1